MRQVLAALVLTVVFMATPAYASSIGVEVLSVTFTATVTVALNSPPDTHTESSTDSVPVSESLSRTWSEGGDSFAEATAIADLLEVSTEAFALSLAGGAQAVAYADSVWTFSPSEDGIADIGIFGEQGFIDATQSVTLFDVTADQLVWQYSIGIGAIGMSHLVPTTLDADHVYSMHLTARARASNDATNSTLRVSGIQAVPENADTLLCLCLGLLFVLYGRWALNA